MFALDQKQLTKSANRLTWPENIGPFRWGMIRERPCLFFDWIGVAAVVTSTVTTVLETSLAWKRSDGPYVFPRLAFSVVKMTWQ